MKNPILLIIPFVIVLGVVALCGTCLNVHNKIQSDIQAANAAAVAAATPDSRTPEQKRFALHIAREAYIKQLEDDLLDKGMDFYFTWEGKSEDTLRVKYVLMSRPLVRKIVDSGFFQNLQSVGVKKVIFTDGYNETWTYNL